MADGQFGGNGSIHWFVNADEATNVRSNGNNGKPWRQSGVDYHGNPTPLRNFTLRIRLPKPPVRSTWWAELSAAIAKVAGSTQPGAVLEFTLPIERGAAFTKQIEILWGAHTVNGASTLGKQASRRTSQRRRGTARTSARGAAAK